MDPRRSSSSGDKPFVVVNPDDESLDVSRQLWTSGDSPQSSSLPRGMSRDEYEMRLWQTDPDPDEVSQPSSLVSQSFTSSARYETCHDSRTPQAASAGTGQAARSGTTHPYSFSTQAQRHGAPQPRSDVSSEQRGVRSSTSSAYSLTGPSSRVTAAGPPGGRPGGRIHGGRDGSARSMAESGVSMSQGRQPDADKGRQSGGSDPVRTVLVRGLSESVSEEALMDYMELRRRSGGGTVESIQMNKREKEAVVTFESPEDAARVADPSRSHQLSQTKLDVSLHRPAPPLPNCLQVCPLPEFDSPDLLLYFVERHTGYDVDKIVYGLVEEDESAVIFFKDNIDVSAAQTALSSQPFNNGGTLKVTTLPSKGVLLVRGLSPGTAEDTLSNYFENPRRGKAGEVTEVKIHRDNREAYALVTLQNPEVAPRVLAQRHTIDNCDLDVSLYLDCLGPGGGSTKRQLKIPNPVRLCAEDQRKISALNRVSAMRRELESLLNDHHASLSENEVACTVTEDTKDARQVLKSWEQDMRRALDGYLQTINVDSVATTSEEFTEARLTLQQMVASAQGGEQVEFFFNQKPQETLLVFRDVHRKLARDMMDTIQAVKQRLAREKQVREETITVPGEEIELLEKDRMDDTINTQVPRLEVRFDVDACKVIMKGVDQEVREASRLIAERRENIIRLRLPYDQFPYTETSRLLRSDRAMNVLREACLEENPKGAVRFRDNCFIVYAFDNQQALQMQTAGRDKIQRKEFKIGENPRVMSSEPVLEALRELETRHGEQTVIDRSNLSQLVLVSVHPEFSTDMARLGTVLEKNSPRAMEFPMESSHLSLLELCLNKGKHGGRLQQQSLDFDHGKNMITTTCTIGGQQDIIESLTKFAQQMVTDTLEFTEPSFKEFITSQQGEDDLKKVETETMCVIRVDNLDAGDARGGPPPEMGWNIPGTTDEQQPAPREFSVPDHTWTGPSVPSAASEIPSKPRLFVKNMYDITSEEHDVLVNSSNTKLDLSMGMVSKALLSVGGQKLQDDCRAKYPKGIKMGDVAVTDPGRTKKDTERDGKWRLQCKKIHHCCLPETTDPDRMRQYVMEAVTKCLTLADRDEMESIGFPALGTGTLKYPTALVVEAMYEAALGYGRNNPGSRVKEVYFIVYKKDTENSQIFLAEHERYNAKVAGTGQGQKAANYMLPTEREEGQKRWEFFKLTRGRVLLRACAQRREDIERAREELLKAYNNQLDVRRETANRLADWDQSFIDQVVMSCKAWDMDVTFNFSMARLELRGLRTVLYNVPLTNIISDAETEVNEREQANLITAMIQWCWVEVDTGGTTHFKPYDAMNNYRIEKAYRYDSNQATVYDNNRVPYRVDFTRMKEIPEHVNPDVHTGNFLDVVRCDIKTELAPQEAPKPDDWTGNKTMDVVKLNTESVEYDRIAQRFKESLNQPRAQIVAIERIQNLTLYRQYMSLRKNMSSRFQGHGFEKEPLWHGTKEESVVSITRHGFNRSYCERNVYGDGAYFATAAENASADKYAPLNAGGERRMFYCKVLTGDYMKGKPGMRCLPKKPNDPINTYDSAVDVVADPSVFVVFKDMQAYPMYLIIFKDN